MLALATVLPAGQALAQDAPKDVPSSHWAYSAVQDLASKGLIKGYPADGNFLGGRSLTRYEMATIIERVLARVDDVISKSNKGDTVSKADLDKLGASIQEVRDLTEEFKKELLVIGADLTKAKDELEALKTQVGELATKVDSHDAKIAAAQKKADEASILVDQALANIDETKSATNAALARKADVGNSGKGKLRFSGLLQMWYGNPLGTSLGGNNPLNTSSAPPGRNFGGGVGDTYRLRRAELGINGNINSVVDFRIMADFAKLAGLTTTNTVVATPSGGTATVLTGVTNTQSTNVLQDAWVGFQLNKRLRFEIGQQKPGLSEEGTRSSAQLLTIERSIMNGLPASAGRIGDIRDAGGVFKYQSAAGYGSIGIWNDNGSTQNSLDSDRTKLLVATGFYTGLRHLTLGVWGGTNIDVANPEPARDRAGTTFKYEIGPHTFEVEGAYTRDRAATVGAAAPIGLGGYALYAHQLSRKWQLVAKYDEWNPSVSGTTAGGVNFGATHHNGREYTFGVNYYLSFHNAKIQLNYIDEDNQGNGFSFFGIRRQIILSNFQASF